MSAQHLAVTLERYLRYWVPSARWRGRPLGLGGTEHNSWYYCRYCAADAHLPGAILHRRSCLVPDPEPIIEAVRAALAAGIHTVEWAVASRHIASMFV